MNWAEQYLEDLRFECHVDDEVPLPPGWGIYTTERGYEMWGNAEQALRAYENLVRRRCADND